MTASPSAGSPPEAFDLVVVGDVMLDVTVEQLAPGSTVHGPINVRAGGTAVNAALWATAAGARAAAVGRVGDDWVGEGIRSALAAAGVEPLLAVDPELSTGTFVAAGPTVAAHRGANRALSPGDVPAGLAAGALLVSGFVLLHEDTRAAGVSALTAIDTGWRGITAGSPLLAGRAGELPGGANALFANADEARVMTGAAPDGALERLAGRYRLVCITLGADGALAMLDGASERRSAAVVRSRARGAGDAFAAGVLVALARGLDLGVALELGCDLGSRAAAGEVAYGQRGSPG